MKTTPLRARTLALALLATTAYCGLSAQPARAQTAGPVPPPEKDTVSPGGVSYKSGAFSYSKQDLAIGAGPFPAGLTLQRSYVSNSDAIFAGGFGTQGWSFNLMATVTNRMVDNLLVQPPQGHERWLYSVSIGGRSVGFLGGSTNPTGGFVGTYTPAGRGSESLVFTGDEQNGHFTFTDSDGTVLYFGSRVEGVNVQTWTAPNGTRLDFTYDGDGLRTVISNRGYALLFEFGNVPGGRQWTKACVVNMAATYVAPFSACPAGAQAATYSYSVSPTNPFVALLTGAAEPTGDTTSYSYVSADHLGCVTLPGQASCQIANTYNVCHRKPTLQEDPPNMRNMDQVIQQVTATGQSYTYSFPASPECPNPQLGTDVTVTTASGAATFVRTNGGGVPLLVTDPLNRSTSFTWYAGGTLSVAAQPASVTPPEGNQTSYAYDARGNLIEQRIKPKPPAAGETAPPDVVLTASYPASCTTPKTCNKPDYVIDANGNRTDYTYSADHGGVLTETGPAVNGVRPQKRNSYAQRYAWVKNASGGYSPAATPVWLLTQTSLCKAGSSAASGTGCANAGEEVVTTYDYGPDSGPNNLLLRGTVVDAGGLGLRTCYAYDANGNKISETTPRATLASCP